MWKHFSNCYTLSTPPSQVDLTGVNVLEVEVRFRPHTLLRLTNLYKNNDMQTSAHVLLSISDWPSLWARPVYTSCSDLKYAQATPQRWLEISQVWANKFVCRHHRTWLKSSQLAGVDRVLDWLGYRDPWIWSEQIVNMHIVWWTFTQLSNQLNYSSWMSTKLFTTIHI